MGVRVSWVGEGVGVNEVSIGRVGAVCGEVTARVVARVMSLGISREVLTVGGDDTTGCLAGIASHLPGAGGGRPGFVGQLGERWDASPQL